MYDGGLTITDSNFMCALSKEPSTTCTFLISHYVSTFTDHLRDATFSLPRPLVHSLVTNLFLCLIIPQVWQALGHRSMLMTFSHLTLYGKRSRTCILRLWSGISSRCLLGNEWQTNLGTLGVYFIFRRVLELMAERAGTSLRLAGCSAF